MSKMISFAEKPYKTEGVSPSKSPKPYYPTITIPIEVFGDKIPNVGSSYRLNVVCEIKEVSKNEERGTQARGDILKGQLVSSVGKVSDEEFAKMKPEDRTKYQEKSIEEA